MLYGVPQPSCMIKNVSIKKRNNLCMIDNNDAFFERNVLIIDIRDEKPGFI